MPLSVGTVIHNRYRIAKLVGQGGFGAVYRAWDLSLEQPVALKENLGGENEAQRRFEREARLLAGLRHPSLPRVIDHFILPGQGQYLIMDFVEGKSLGQLLAERGRPLDEAEALPWIRQVCDALEYLHTRTPPIIHRDIKPLNIIVTPDNRAILVDFGISKVYTVDHTTTQSVQAVTHGFSPPEQYGVGRTDPRSDVYALGATLYMLLTGQPPPNGPDLASGTDMLTPPRQLNPAVSETTAAAVVAAMTPMISQRLGSVASLRALLSPGAAPPPATSSAPVGQPTRRVDASRPLGRGRGVPIWGWIGGVLGLVALAAVIFWALGRGGGDTPTATPENATIVAVVTDSPVVTHTPTPPATPPATATVPPTATATAIPSLTAEATIPPQPGDIRVVTRGNVTVEQVFVPGGSFTMGSDANGENERPAHTVTLDAFWIDRTEVTNAQFAAFVEAIGYQTAGERTGGNVITNNGPTHNPDANWRQPQGLGSNLDGREQHPVVLVTWHDATAFCAWAGGRLPSEAAWEYAARGPEGPMYPWGDAFEGQLLNSCDRNCPLARADMTIDDGFALTAPAGSFPAGASWVGALDMSGNAFEWVNDWYAADAYSSAPAENPTGPITGDARVLRSGAWSYGPNNARASFRSNAPPDGRGNSIGFRCRQE